MEFNRYTNMDEYPSTNSYFFTLLALQEGRLRPEELDPRRRQELREVVLREMDKERMGREIINAEIAKLRMSLSVQKATDTAVSYESLEERLGRIAALRHAIQFKVKTKTWGILHQFLSSIQEMDDKKQINDSHDQYTDSNWAELTHECLINILFRLSLEDRWRGVMRVCKAWHEACKDPCLNSVLDLETTHFDSATELPRFWTHEFERRVDNMLRSVVLWSEGSLVEIRVRHCSDRSLAVVAQRCPNLEVLSIKSSPLVTDKTISEIASGCPKIKELDISYCYEISHKSLTAIGSHCPNLRILRRNLMNWMDPSHHARVIPREYLNACPQDGDSEAAAIAKFMPNLLHLEIRCLKLSVSGLNAISERCHDLEYLDLSGCANMTSRDIANAESNLKRLKTVKRPNFYIPRSVFHTERYGHWNLYDERFQTDVFRI